MSSYMKRAIELAKKGLGFTNPNPLVGAVLVRDGSIISEGYHKVYGGPHAEVMTIGNRKNLQDTTLYVTLEPCCHYGKTPPCTDLIIESGISHVVVATLDPNPMVAGKGVEKLKHHGITVEVGCMEAEARKLNEVFNFFMTYQEPFVVVKYAMTLDGNIATHHGDSKWISGNESRKRVHKLRQKMSGIMIGIGTVIKDDPQLTTRLEGHCSNPLPIILDSKGRIPLEAKVLKRPTIIATTSQMSIEKKVALEAMGSRVLVLENENNQVDLPALMIKLGQLGIDSVLVEGGSEVIGSMLKHHLVNQLQVYIAPKLVGQGQQPIRGMTIDLMSDAQLLDDVTIEIIESDMYVVGSLRRRICSQE